MIRGPNFAFDFETWLTRQTPVLPRSEHPKNDTLFSKDAAALCGGKR